MMSDSIRGSEKYWSLEVKVTSLDFFVGAVEWFFPVKFNTPVEYPLFQGNARPKP